MNRIIDMNSEVLIDRSQVQNPYLQLLLAALGQELAKGSPWVAVNKRIASRYEVLLEMIYGENRSAAA